MNLRIICVKHENDKVNGFKVNVELSEIWREFIFITKTCKTLKTFFIFDFSIFRTRITQIYTDLS